MDKDIVEIDDAQVREVRDELAKPISISRLKALERSLRLRGLDQTWLHRVTCKAGLVWEPPLGVQWASCFDVLTLQGLPVSPVLALLAEAGVLSTRWLEPARELAFHVRGRR